jgi:hypothetical protein
MPSSVRLGLKPETAERTVLFPQELLPVGLATRTPRTGTSARQQWLVQVQGPLGQRRRRLEFPAGDPQITLGSGEGCRGLVRHPSVSRLHAALVRRARRGVYLVDLSSRDGTFLNGEPVRGEVLLMDGDRISLGRKVTFEFLDGPRPESKVRRWARRMLEAGLRP